MDPQRAYDVFQAAAMTTSMLSQSRVCFFEIPDPHFAEVRGMKSRNEAAALAKKYVKACGAVAELEKPLETNVTPTRMYRSPQVCHNSPAPISQDPSLAIVPLVKGAPVDAPLSACNSDFSRRESPNPKRSPSHSMITEQMRNVSQSVVFQF